MIDNDLPKKPTRTRRKTNYKGADNKKTSGLVPRTENQKALIDALKESSQVFILGPAGTGKTYVTRPLHDERDRQDRHHKTTRGCR